MAKKKEDQTLPVNLEDDNAPSSAITYANEVIAIIAGLAASEVEGVAGMVNVNSGLKGKNRNVTRGVKVEVGTEEVSVDLYLNVEYGTPIQRAAHDAQEGVKKSIESMTGLHVVRVDVHVLGVSFEKEKNALQAGAGKANLEAGESAETAAPVNETPKAETQSAEPVKAGEQAEPAFAQEEPAFEVKEGAGEPASTEEENEAAPVEEDIQENE